MKLARDTRTRDELNAHRERLIDDYLAQGMDRRAAERRAFLEFGNTAVIEELSRDVRGRWWEDLSRDVRFAGRTLRRQPGFALVAVLSLTLGIGANSAIFTVINKIVLRPIPAVGTGRLVSLNNVGGPPRAFPLFSYLDYRDLRDRSTVTSGLVAYTMAPVSLSHDGINERVWGYLVSGNYFSELGVGAALGRVFGPDDDRVAGAHPVAVVSHASWRERFGADPAIVGRDITVNGRTFRVIGVAPPGFIGLEVNYVPDVWFPLMMQSAIRPGQPWLDDRAQEALFVAGRLAPGVSTAQATSAFRSLAAQLALEHPVENDGMQIDLSPTGLFGAAGRGPILGFSGALMAVVGLVLVLVCANLANLLLARGLDRRREMALRLALGASRLRIVRQLLTESLVVAVAGGALGMVLAFWLSRTAAAFRPPMDVPLSIEAGLDGRVVVFTVAITVVASVLFGLLPAWQATRRTLTPGLNDRPSADPRRSRLRNGLVATQVALSLVLMIPAGLVLGGLQRLHDVALGFNPDQAVKLSFDLDLQAYDPARGRELGRELLRRVRELPGVEAAGLGNPLPLELYVAVAPVHIDGTPPTRAGDAPLTGVASVSPGYFQAIGTRLLKGRGFSDQDDERSMRVAVVTAGFARTFWPDGDAIGRQISLPGRADGLLRIVGTVEDGKYRNLGDRGQPFVFLPIAQSYSGLATLVVRTPRASAQVISEIRRELERLDPHLPVFGAMPLTEHLRLPLFPARLAAAALGSFGVLSLTLAAIGLFGVMAHRVRQRTHEIGLRMALGAARRDVLRMLLGQSMATVASGVAVGLAGAYALTRLMTGLIFGVSATDPLTFAGVAMLLVSVAFAASYLPARRATRVDPLIALRHE